MLQAGLMLGETALEGRILGFDMHWLTGEVPFQLLNTCIMVLILYFILYKPVGKFLQARTTKIQNQLTTAETNLADANKLKADYAARLAKIEDERNEIIEAARKRGQEREAKIIKDAEAEAENIKSRALLDIQREQAKARDDIKVQMVEIASLMAQRYVTQQMDEKTQSSLLDKAITDLGDVKWLS